MESSKAGTLTAFVLYDKRTGDVVHIHTEHAAGGQEHAPTEAGVLAELGRLLPPGVDVGALRTEEPLAPVRGTRLFVDVQAKTLMRVRADEQKAATRKPAGKASAPKKPATKKATKKATKATKAASTAKRAAKGERS